MSKSKKEIREHLERTLNDYIFKIELWENVKVVTKKDGAPFKNFSQNFDGCSVSSALFHDRNLEVSGRAPSGKWLEDSINTSILLSDYTKIFGAPEESRICKESFLADWVVLTIPESKKMIENRINLYKARIEEYNKQLELLDSAYDEIMEKTKELYYLLDNVTECSGFVKNTLYRDLQEKIKNYPY